MPIAIIEYEKGVAPRISGKVLLVLASKPNCSFCNTVLGIRRDRRSKDYLNPNIRTLASGGRLTRVCCDCHTANQLYQLPLDSCPGDASVIRYALLALCSAKAKLF
jgi:hypothetical protein